MDSTAWDRRLVELDVGPGGRTATFVVKPSARPDGAMYGGAGIAAAIMAMEAATGRAVLWVTTQFVRAPRAGQTVRCDTDVLADGGRTAQVRMTATVDGDLAFLSLGSVGLPRADGLDGQYAEMPGVAPPDASGAGLWSEHRPWGTDAPVTYREAALVDDTAFGHVALWARRTDGAPFTAAALAYVADMVPIAVARASGRIGAGSSLDNSMRFGDLGAHQWVLLELAGDFARGGYGSGSLRAWSPDGALLATGGQTTNMKYLFDEDALPEALARLRGQHAPT